MTRVGTAPTSYFGGKQQLAPRICALFPPHETYIEPFLGAGAVYFTKTPAALSILNDADGLLVNFFRVLRDPAKGARLREALSLTLYAREEWADARLGLRAVARGWDEAADDVELARRWFVLSQMSFAGRMASGAVVAGGRADRRGHGSPGLESTGWRFSRQGGKHNPAASFRSAIDRLPGFAAQLANAQIEHDDALHIIARYDGPHVLQYLDPPYEPSTRSGGGYAHEMSLEDHACLLDLITAPTFRSMVVLSSYDSALYRERLEQQCGWQRLEVQVACSAAGRTRASVLQGEGAVYRAGQTRTEILWLNPAAQRRQGLWAGLDEPADEPTPEPLTTVGKGHSTGRRQPSTRKGKAQHGR